MLSDAIMYKALVEKDPSFEGSFIAAVKTTGIFCRPTCTARKPKPENVEFFGTTSEALRYGYRPCKVCHPLELPGHTPNPIKELIHALATDPSVRFRDGDLRKKGLEPATVRRWFLRHHGITFQSYQRMFRINSAFKKMQQGESVLSAAYDTGYESISGFSDSFRTIFGVSPVNSRQTRLIDLTRLETPLGTMIACAVEEGICLLEFSDRKMLETELKTLAKRMNATILQGENVHFQQLREELKEYFEGKRKTFSLPLYLDGSPFQQRVWDGLQTILYGETRSYAQQAALLSAPGAVRAVANANGMNHICIIIPCHRVIGSNGALTGYGGGLWRKQWLLDHERSHHSRKFE